MVLGIIIGATGGTEIEKRSFCIKGHILNEEVFKGDINMGWKWVNEARLSSLSDSDVPIQSGKASELQLKLLEWIILECEAIIRACVGYKHHQWGIDIRYISKYWSLSHNWAPCKTKFKISEVSEFAIENIDEAIGSFAEKIKTGCIFHISH